MSENDDTRTRVTRRTFVASGVAAGAAVVWTSPFPFSDSPIGQTAEAQGLSGPTGGPPPTPTGSTGGTGGTGNTGPAGKSKLTITSKGQLKEKKGHVVAVGISVTGSKAVKGKVKLDTMMKGKRRSIGSASFNVPAGGGARNVRVRLNKVGRELSGDRKRIPTRITASGNGVASKRKAVAIKTLSA